MCVFNRADYRRCSRVCGRIWAAGLPDVRNISTARFLNSSWYGLIDFIGVCVMRYFPLR